MCLLCWDEDAPDAGLPIEADEDAFFEFLLEYEDAMWEQEL